LKEGVTLKQQQEREAEFFKNNMLSKHKGVRLGVPLLQKELSTILVKKVCPQLFKVVEELDDIIRKTEHSGDFLSKLAAEEDSTTVSKDLEVLVKKLNPSSAHRMDFEKKFMEKLGKTFRSIINQEFKRQFKIVESEEGNAMSFRDFPTLSQPALSPLAKDPEHPYEDEIGRTRLYVTEHMGRMLKQRYKSFKDMLPPAFDPERFQRTFIFGENAPHKITDKSMHNAKDRVLEQSALLSFFDFRFPDDMKTTRVEWMENLERCVNSLTDPKSPNNLQTVAFRLVMNDLDDFVNSIQIGGVGASTQKTQLTKEFGKFLFGNIGEQINDEYLNSSIYHLLCTEKRAKIDFRKFGHQLSQVTQGPRKFYGWWSGVQKCDIPVYQYQWTKAYGQMMADRATELVFGTIAVNLLDPLIFKAIQYSLNIFKGDRMAMEAQKQVKKLEELRTHRATLLNAIDTYNVVKINQEEEEDNKASEKN